MPSDIGLSLECDHSWGNIPFALNPNGKIVTSPVLLLENPPVLGLYFGCLCLICKCGLGIFDSTPGSSAKPFNPSKFIILPAA